MPLPWVTNIQTTWETILAALGALAILAGGVKIIMGFFSPYRKLRELVAKHGELLDKDNKRILRGEEADAMTLSSLFALLNHALTGNSREALKAARDNLQDYLAKR